MIATGLAETESADAAYTRAADALTDGQLALYDAIRAAYPALDWSGHDRRAARLRGEPLGPDPALASSLRPDPYVAWAATIARRRATTRGGTASRLSL